MTPTPTDPAILLRRQAARQRTLLLILSALMILLGVLLLGGLGLWVMFSLMPAEEGVVVGRLMPGVRLVSAYSALLLLLCWMTRRAVQEQWRTARRWNLGLIAALVVGLPLGPVLALGLLPVLAPAQWADSRPRSPRAR